MTFLAIERGLERAPDHWKRVNFKRAFAPVEGRAGTNGAGRLSLASAGHLYPREGTSDRQQASDATEARSLLVEPGDLVINPMWLTGGSIAVSDLAGAVSPDYRVFRPSADVHPRFAHHVMRSRSYMDQYALFIRANTTFDRRVQQVDIDAMPIAMPSLDEQQRIADFLDDQVARVDRIIAARRQQVSAFTRVREARLQQLHDELSGRFGEGRLGHLILGIEQGWSPQAEGTPAADHEWGVMRSGCLNGGWFRSKDNKRLPDRLEPRVEYELRANDLLMSRASGSLDLIGSVAVVPADVRPNLLLCDKIYRITPTEGWNPELLAHLMSTRRNRERIRLGVSGAEGMANNLPSRVVRDLRIPLVPRDCQSQVLLRADAYVNPESVGMVALNRSIDLVGEYKTSLITAAVTGELDVRTAGSGIPA